MNKRVLTKEMKTELKGFEEVVEDYMPDEDPKNKARREKENAKVGEQYELQQYLEIEIDRLTSLENFFSKKIPLLINFSQTAQLVLAQLERKKEVKENLNDELLDKDSQLQKNLGHLFNSHFS